MITVPFKTALEMDPTIESEVLSQYPIYNEGYRDWLNQQIKDQYWNQEIGMESVSLFKLALKRKLNQIMPYYNKQYKADLIAEGLDPLQTLKIENRAENSGKTESTSGSESDSESDSRARGIGSDFPQTALSGNGDYASSGQDSTSKTTSKGKADEKSATEQTASNRGTVTGSQGHASSLLMQHRQTLVNVDVMVLNDLKDLFLGIWSTHDSYTKPTLGIYGYGYGLQGF